MVIYVVILSTLAAIIASQALISGSFTLVSEAISFETFAIVQNLLSRANFGTTLYPSS